MARKEARRQLHKDVASNIKQVLMATPKKLYGHLSPITKIIPLDEPGTLDIAGWAVTSS